MSNSVDLKIKKFPYLGHSSNLIEYFLLIGYSNEYIQTEIINKISSTELLERSTSFEQKPVIQEFKCLDKPEIINSIPGNPTGEMIYDNMILDFLFPSPPSVYYYYSKESQQCDSEQPQYSVIFFINNDNDQKTKNPFHAYSLVFYENKIGRNGERIFIPKTLCFISQWPFFTFFNSIQKEIIRQFSNENLEIPIEILIYNIVNFIPSPINHNLCLSLFPNRDLATYQKSILIDNQQNILNHLPQNQQNFLSKQILNQLSGYPMLDFNLSEIFHILTKEVIIEILFFNLLETNMLFFGSDLEHLNLVMYIISCLSYPCTDSIYLWHILSVSGDEVKNQMSQSVFVAKPCASMVGINCAYDDSIKTCSLYESHFVVDLDKKNIFFKYLEKKDEDKNKSYIQEVSRILSLESFIKKIFSGKTSSSPGFLESSIKKLLTELGTISKKVTHINHNNGQIVPKFFMNENSNLTLNKSIQEAFYNFVLSILKVFYNFYELENEEEVEKEKTSKENLQNSSHLSGGNASNLSGEKGTSSDDSFPRGSFRERKRTKKGKNYFMKYKENFSTMSNEEKSFCILFKDSCKYMNFVELFMGENECLQMYKVPMKFCEEFISLKMIDDNKINSHFFEIIDQFYLEKGNQNLFSGNPLMNQNFKYVNFIQFYSYYEQNLKKLIFEEVASSPIIKSSSTKAFKKVKMTYKYKAMELDNNILLKYIYFLNNLQEDELIKIFPSIELQKQIQIEENKARDIVNSIEKSLIQYKILTCKDLIILSFFVVVGVLSEIFVGDEKLINIFCIITKKNKLCLRKYISTIINIYSRIIERKLENKENPEKEFNFYYLLLDFMREDKDKKILPNEDLLIVIKKLKLLEEKREEMFPEKEIMKEEEEEDFVLSSEVKRLVKSSTMVINDKEVFKQKIAMKLNEGQLIPSEKESQRYRMFLKRNFCSEGTKEPEYFLQMAENIDYEGDLSICCEKCSYRMSPILFLKDVNKKQDYNIGLFSPLKIFNESNKQMSLYFPSLEQNKIDYKMVCDLMINIMFYFENLLKFNKSVSEQIFLYIRELNQKKNVYKKFN